MVKRKVNGKQIYQIALLPDLRAIPEGICIFKKRRITGITFVCFDSAKDLLISVEDHSRYGGADLDVTVKGEVKQQGIKISFSLMGQEKVLG
jgi:hypothetical protein